MNIERLRRAYSKSPSLTNGIMLDSPVLSQNLSVKINDISGD